MSRTKRVYNRIDKNFTKQDGDWYRFKTPPRWRHPWKQDIMNEPSLWNTNRKDHRIHLQQYLLTFTLHAQNVQYFYVNLLAN